MSLDSLVEEIRRQGAAELAGIVGRRDAETAKIVAERDLKVASARSEIARAADIEIAHERAQRLAAAKLHARKQLYEAREKRLEEGIGATRTLLEAYTRSSQYPAVLKRMVAAATLTLGKQLRIQGRSEDAAVLGKVAGKSFDATPQPILGGLVAETTDGSRRLNLSFDELLRLREDRVRELLA